MDLFESIRFFNTYGKLPVDCMRDAVMQHALFEGMILSEGEQMTPETVDVLNKIKNGDFVRNDYVNFMHSALKTLLARQFLTPYKPQELADSNVQTFEVRGYDIGFGLKPMPNGGVDIICVHNNSGVKGIGDALIDAAIKYGGTQLDHYDGYLSNFYANKGFEETGRMKWNDEYAPAEWDYNKFKRPDVILRKLKNVQSNK